MMHKTWIRAFAGMTAICLIVPSMGCATMSGAGTNVSYLDGATSNFSAGEKALTEKRYEEAQAFFEHVRSKYPFSKFAALADLRVADAYFAQRLFDEAAESYEFFVRFHPNHESVPQAMFMAAKAYYEAIPSDFFIFPASYVKDQSSTKDALRVVESYLEQYPSDPNVPDAQKLQADLQTRLSKHDLHVARFYAQRSKWSGALARYEIVAKKYPQATTVPDALYEGGLVARDRLNDMTKAAELFKALVERFADNKLAQKAQNLLAELEKQIELSNNTELEQSSDEETSEL